MAAALGGIGPLAGTTLEYRDVVTSGVLIAMIALRPEGILGRPLPDTVSGGAGPRRH